MKISIESPAGVETRELAGDDYLLEEHGGALTAMLADVSGKGIGAALAAGRARPLAELARAVESAVREFVGGEPDADDRTLVLLRREPF